MKRARIFLIDDYPLFCEGIRLILERDPELQVVGQAHDRPAALEKFRQLAPDLALLSHMLANVDGITLAGELMVEAPQARFILLSTSPNTDFIDRAIQAGIHGYLFRARGGEELLQAVHSVLAGNFYMCPQASTTLLASYRQILASSSESRKPELTERELQVLKLTAEGLRVKAIALRLAISVKTVDTHRSNLMVKLGCSSSAELTRFAIRKGIIAP